MPPLAILIGFQYTEEYGISGTIFDLYKVSSFCESRGYTIKIISDIVPDTSSITNEDLDFNKFIGGIYTKRSLVYTMDNFVETIKTLCLSISQSNEIMIYYSGHGVKSSIFLPSKERFSFDSFKNLVFPYFQEKSQVFLVFDCCGAPSFSLPYKMKHGSPTANSDNFIVPSIILINSTNGKEKAAAIANKYSLFTNALFEELELITQESSCNLSKMISQVSKKVKKEKSPYHQNSSCYVSYPDLKYLWSWVTHPREPRIFKDDTFSNILVFVKDGN